MKYYCIYVIRDLLSKSVKQPFSTCYSSLVHNDFVLEAYEFVDILIAEVILSSLFTSSTFRFLVVLGPKQSIGFVMYEQKRDLQLVFQALLKSCCHSFACLSWEDMSALWLACFLWLLANLTHHPIHIGIALPQIVLNSNCLKFYILHYLLHTIYFLSSPLLCWQLNLYVFVLLEFFDVYIIILLCSFATIMIPIIYTCSIFIPTYVHRTRCTTGI